MSADVRTSTEAIFHPKPRHSICLWKLQQKIIDPFIKKLKRLFPKIPVNKVDERFTSGMALKTMIDGGVKKKNRRDKSMVDKISAAIILQSFLEKRQQAPGARH